MNVVWVYLIVNGTPLVIIFILGFVLNKDPACEVTIDMVSSLKVKFKFDLDYDDFFANGNKASLTQTVASFLGIDASRIRIVNIRKGSVIIEQAIMPEETVA
jgi:hypothetical protein